MESAANSHHQFQDQFLASSSYGVGTHPWSNTTVPNSILNTNSLSSSSQENTTLHSSNMAPDLSFHWANNNNNTASNFSTNLSPQDLHLSRIKDELSEHYYRKYTEILSSSSPQSTTTDEYNLNENDVGTKLLFKSFSSGNLMNKVVSSTNGSTHHGDFYSGNGVRSGFVSQIFPSINISNDLNQHPAAAASNLDMNLDALDLLAASSRFNGNFDHSSQNQAGIFRDGFLNYGFDHMQQAHQIPLLYGSNNKVSAGSSNVVGEAKRSSSKISMDQPKAPTQNAPKKSRLEARASCPPFKVRKEKLGDRIAALQQLVAPFGKTDTASVLMEAIGYIKFLQSQVETLSVPYMKASRNRSSRVMKGGPAENETEEPKRDLKGRGLCLVPLSCLSYITDGGGAAVWPPPHFGGAT